MSGRLVGAALEAELAAIPPSRRRSARAVLVVLAEATGRAGVAWPSRETIARRVDLSTRSVRRILTELEDAGYLHTDHRAGGRATTRWTLHGLHPARGDTGVPPGGTRVAPEPEENRSPPLPPAQRGAIEQGPWTAPRVELEAELHLPGLSPREAGTSPRALGTNPRGRRRELERQAAREASAALEAHQVEARRRFAELEELARSPEARAAAAAVRARFLKR